MAIRGTLSGRKRTGQTPRAQELPDTQNVLHGMLLEAYREYIEARDLLAEVGLYQTAKSGYVALHPATKIRDNAQRVFMKLCPLVRGYINDDSGFDAMLAEVCGNG